jgi:hypothetical protein
MTRLAASLPAGPRGRLLAVALTCAVVAAAWAGIADPLLGWYDGRAERLSERVALERRMRAVVATLPALRRAAESVSSGARSGGAGSGGPAVLDGATDAIAAARLQETMQAIAGRAGASLSSLETLAAAPDGTYRRIALRVALSAPWPVLVALLRAVGESAPPLLVDDLRVAGSHLVARPAVMPLDVSFTVMAFRAAPTPR